LVPLKTSPVVLPKRLNRDDRLSKELAPSSFLFVFHGSCRVISLYENLSAHFGFELGAEFFGNAGQQLLLKDDVLGRQVL